MTMLDLHQRAMRLSVAAVDAVRDDQWDLPTPCSQWTLRQLLEHMTNENRGFAAAADGETADRTVWSSWSFDDDPRASYARSAERVVAAFGADGVFDREFWLPRIKDTVRFPARQAISFHLLDYVVHTWDVAMATGNPIAFEADLVDAVREIADREVPDGPNRRRTDPSFRPPVPVPDSSSAQDRLLAYLGRSPDWERP